MKQNVSVLQAELGAPHLRVIVDGVALFAEVVNSNVIGQGSALTAGLNRFNIGAASF